MTKLVALEDRHLPVLISDAGEPAARRFLTIATSTPTCSPPGTISHLGVKCYRNHRRQRHQIPVQFSALVYNPDWRPWPIRAS